MKKLIMLSLCCFFVFLGCNSGGFADHNIESIEEKVDTDSLGEEISITIKERSVTSSYTETDPAIMLVKNIDGFETFAKEYLNYIVTDEKRTAFEDVLKDNYIIAVFMGKRMKGGFNLILDDKSHINEGKLYLSAEFKIPSADSITTFQITSPYVIAGISKSRMSNISAIILYDNKDSTVKSVNTLSYNVFE